jgi:hypothetical protein
MGSALGRRLRPALNCFPFCLAAAQAAVEQELQLLETAETDRGGAVEAVAGQQRVLVERQATAAMAAVL